MFDRLEDLLHRYEEIMNELNEPDVTANQERFRALMKEQSDLTPLVEAYREYKKAKQDVEDSLAMLEEENDEEMRELLKEEHAEAKKRIGLNRVTFDDARRSVRFTVPGMSFDLGGIAKGFAVDKAAEAVLALGVRQGIIDLGGNLRVLPEPPPGRTHYR